MDLSAIATPANIRAAQCELARRRLDYFCGAIDIPGAPVDEDVDEDQLYPPIKTPPAAHHKLLIEKLEAVERGDIKRLMVFMPPGSAKSTYASVIFPVWFMGRKKRRNVIVATYASDLARKIGRRARSIVKQKAFEEIFGFGLSNDSSAADEWALGNENEFMGGGVLSGITGNRADLIVIDDPIKGRQEADSEVIRERTKAEFDDSIKTRGKPGYRIVLIQTRWHEDDLAGSILPEDYDGQSGPILCRDGDVWEVLCLPAEAGVNDPLGRKPGEFLWPEWFDADHWKTFKANQRTWSALYQQSPAPEDGTYFKREYFVRYRPADMPKNLRFYGTSDYAVTEGGGDFTVHRVWGIDHEGGMWLQPGGYKAQETPDKWIEAQIDLVQRFKPFAWFGEAGVIQKATEPMLKRRCRERGVGCRFEWMPSIQDKPTRARGAQSRAAMGMVYVPEGPEGDAVIAEYLKFPAGKHDDDVDNLSLMGRALDDVHPAILPPMADPKQPIKGVTDMTWNDLMDMQTQDSYERA